jgi:hypothetical protein
MKKTPVSLVKERFESKEKLVAAVQKLATQDLWLDRVSSVKGLGRVSNAKLVRLHDTLTDAKKRFGSRDKLVSSIVELKKRVKDKGFASKLAAYPLPQLLDLHAAAERESKRVAKAPAAPAKAAKAEKAAAKPKAAAKAAPKAKAAAKA